MSVNTESIIHHIMERISEIGYVKPEDIPNIDLYMDQVTTFMEAQLAHSKRYKDDKILTKTMINNYAKNKIYQIFLSFSESEDESFSVSIGST